VLTYWVWCLAMGFMCGLRVCNMNVFMQPDSDAEVLPLMLV
jgi:hypothetical protein